ncbi:uncharacterized protein VTP21DRAFT_6813 [Calcarisporiella thermophila]|uniref:uncharacterized protein n=1 Tax=Calcarisporiella thermophila TaxID=911321 RepID=UPI0037421898
MEMAITRSKSSSSSIRTRAPASPTPNSTSSSNSSTITTTNNKVASSSRLAYSPSPPPSTVMATPEPSRGLVKPLETAFMSTGLLSKRTRLKNMSTREFHKPMPDTPCKRPPLNTAGIITSAPHAFNLAFSPTSTGNSFSPTTPIAGASTDLSSLSPSSSSVDGSPLSLGANRKHKGTFPEPKRPKKPHLAAESPSPLSPSPAQVLFLDNTPTQQMSHGGFLTVYPHFLRREYFRERWRNRHFDTSLFMRDPSYDSQTNETGACPDYFETQFNIIARLGHGEFSEAFKVQEKSTGRLFAVKKTKYPFIGTKDRLSRLEEVDILWSLGRHAHVIELVDAWEQFGHLYLQMELCENGSLDTYLEQYGGRIEEIRIWQILGDLAMGLAHIHDSHVLHLDLKPSNVLISNAGTLRIGDFGMATRWPVTTEIEREGDREYMAPEILSGQYDKPADVFSLGLIMLEVAADIVLPDHGPEWQKLRQGDFSGVAFPMMSNGKILFELIQQMLNPEPGLRPSVGEILKHPLLVEAMGAELLQSG